jgi:acetylornithine/N-succinyldiaminopimelate aminotransferase
VYGGQCGCRRHPGAGFLHRFPHIYEDARGMGLLQGLKCVRPQGTVLAACVAEGLMAITAGDNVGA